MPSTYAHRRFGADVLVQLPRELREKITPYRPLYDMGLHGPDLMFYYRALQSNPVNRLGNAMHEQPGRVFRAHYTGEYKDKDWMQHLQPEEIFQGGYTIEIDE